MVNPAMIQGAMTALSAARNQGASGQGQLANAPTGLQGAQTQWANQYIQNVNKGQSDPNNLNRYLDYQYMLPGAKNSNLTYGSSNSGTLQQAQQDFMNKYSQAIQNGTNNLSQLGQYQGYLKAFGAKAATPNQQAMQQLSIGALNGDIGAQNYLRAMNLKPVQGQSLWQGYDPSQLKANTGAWSQYIKDNPYSSTAKNDDMFKYAQYNNAMKTGTGLDGNEMQQYNNIVGKWNLTDMTDPYNQNIDQISQDKQAALKGQDVSLNQTMQALDAKNFQNMQMAMQDQTNRGMGDTGFAQEAYNQATMAANQNYAKAFADAANQKATLADKYDTAIANQKDLQTKDQQQVAQNQAQNLLAQQKENNAQMNFQQTQQMKQDQFLTAQTGTVFLGGKQLLGKAGKPITTIDWQKMTETQRHDIATENLTAQGQQNTYNLGLINANNNAQKISNDYNLGLTNANITSQRDQNNYNLGVQKNNITWNLGVLNNNTKYQLGLQSNNNQAAKIANDFQIAYGNLQVNIQKQNLAASVASANIEDAKGKLAIAAQSAATNADKVKAGELGKSLDVINSEINAYAKANPGKPVPQEYKDALGNILNQMAGINFQSNQGGVVPTAPAQSTTQQPPVQVTPQGQLMMGQ